MCSNAQAHACAGGACRAGACCGPRGWPPLARLAAWRPSSTRCAAPSFWFSRRIHLRLLVTAPWVSRITRRELDLRNIATSSSADVCFA